MMTIISLLSSAGKGLLCVCVPDARTAPKDCDLTLSIDKLAYTKEKTDLRSARRGLEQIVVGSKGRSQH